MGVRERERRRSVWEIAMKNYEVVVCFDSDGNRCLGCEILGFLDSGGGGGAGLWYASHQWCLWVPSKPSCLCLLQKRRKKKVVKEKARETVGF